MSGVSPQFIGDVELNLNDAMFHGHDVADTQIRFSTADPLLTGFKLAVRHDVGFRVS